MKQDWTPQEGEAAKAARNMLRELMEERRWRIPQLADALDISVDIVRRWEQGKSGMDDFPALPDAPSLKSRRRRA